MSACGGRFSCDQVSVLATVGHLVGGFTEYECWAPPAESSGALRRLRPRSLWWGHAAGQGEVGEKNPVASY